MTLRIFVLALLVTASCGIGEAKKSADAYAQRNWGEDVKSVECMTKDSDSDGYVSCTVLLKSAPAQPVPIECGTERGMSCNSGCRVATGNSAKQ